MTAMPDFSSIHTPVTNGCPDLSVVIPVFNERQVIPELLARLSAVIASLLATCEIIFIDDGSTDGSDQALLQLAATRYPAKIIFLSRNFGKEAALSAGLANARGAAVVVMDADLQDPPELIGDMYAAFLEGADVVCMKRRSRAGESLSKRLSAYLFYRLLSFLSEVPIPEDVGDFRLLSRKAVDALNRLPERNRYMKGLFAWIGLPTKTIEYDRSIRAAGTTKWNFFSLLRLALEGITSFSVSLLRIATSVGLIAALVGAGFGLWIVIDTLIFGNPVAGYPSLIAAITFMGGVQLFATGLVGEYVGRTYLETKQRPLYVVRDIVQPEQASQSVPRFEERYRHAASR